MIFKILLSTLLFSSSILAQNIEIFLDGKPHKKLNLEEIKNLKSETVEFYNYVTKRAELYKGVPFFTLMEKYAPETIDSMVEIELNSVNEFKYFFPRELFEVTNSILSYERADGDTFTRYSQKQKMLVPVGPLYLIWNLKNIKKDDRLNFKSVYQINKINVITSKNEFGVTEDAVDKSVFLGLQAYRKNCISCHAIGKLGGGISFDLVKRKTLETKGADYIKKYILDPASIDPETQMLPLPKYKNQAEIAQGIVDFLNFMRNPDEVLKKHQHNQGRNSYKALKEVVEQSLK